MKTTDSVLGYRRFLETRDGSPDLHRGILPRRDAFFAAIEREPVRSKVEFDREVFLRNVTCSRVGK